MRQLVEITSLRGKFFNTMGFADRERNFLYPEEALLLLEQGRLILMDELLPMLKTKFYGIVIEQITIPAYLAYMELKVSIRFFAFII